jgi:hypothetical protein
MLNPGEPNGDEGEKKGDDKRKEVLRKLGLRGLFGSTQLAPPRRPLRQS